MGADHLLLVDRMGFTESYKRFYFRDIQAVIIRKTNTATVGNCIMGLLALLFAAWALTVVNMTGRITLWAICGCFGYFTLMNLLRGSTCVTHIKTAVQTELLPQWNRLPRARRGLKRIRPALLQAQGEVSAQELKARLEELVRRQTQGPAADAT
jgi:low affinity Fe/Cu permease